MLLGEKKTQRCEFRWVCCCHFSIKLLAESGVDAKGEGAPIVNLGFLGLAALLLTGLFVRTAQTCFTQDAFTVELLFEATESFVHGLAFFQSNFNHFKSPHAFVCFKFEKLLLGGLRIDLEGILSNR